MKAYDWKKDGKYLVCANKDKSHVPSIRFNADGTYTVVGVDGKPRTERKVRDAIKFAIETHKRMAKFNKNFKD